MKIKFLILTLISTFAPILTSNSPSKKSGKGKSAQKEIPDIATTHENLDQLLKSFEDFVGEHNIKQPAKNIRLCNEEVKNPVSGLIDPLYQITLFAETLALIQKSEKGSKINIFDNIKSAYLHKIINAYSPGSTKLASCTHPSLLHVAAHDGSPEVIKMLLIAGAEKNINKYDTQFKTPLHYLFYKALQTRGEELGSTIKAIQLLLDAGADPEKKDAKDQTSRGILNLAIETHNTNKRASLEDKSALINLMQQLPTPAHQSIQFSTKDPGRLRAIQSLFGSAGSTAATVAKTGYRLFGQLYSGEQRGQGQRCLDPIADNLLDEELNFVLVKFRQNTKPDDEPEITEIPSQ